MLQLLVQLEKASRAELDEVVEELALTGSVSAMSAWAWLFFSARVFAARRFVEVMLVKVPGGERIQPPVHTTDEGVVLWLLRDLWHSSLRNDTLKILALALGEGLQFYGVDWDASS